MGPDCSAPVTRDWKGIDPFLWDYHIAGFLPKPARRPYFRRKRRRGRPRIPDRLCFEALVWLVLTDGVWTMVPTRFANARTARRRLRLWWRNGLLTKLWWAYLHALDTHTRRQVERAMRLTGTRKRTFWRFTLDLQAGYEASERPYPFNLGSSDSEDREPEGESEALDP